MKKKLRSKRGQTLVEYIILVVIIAIAVISVAGAFSDRIRTLFTGATVELGGTQAQDASTQSATLIKKMTQSGIQ